jgi:hypothetical protein
MGKFRLSNRLKFFHRHPSSSPTALASPRGCSLDVGGPRSPGGRFHEVVGDLKSDSGSDASNVSTETDGSISSKDRFAGPIDSDTLRKYRWKVRRVRAEGANARVLPKIVESPSSSTFASSLEKNQNGTEATTDGDAEASPLPRRAFEDDDSQHLKFTIPPQCSSGESQESNFINGNNVTEKLDETSPSSVMHMFNSSYLVEIDLEGSHSDDNSAVTYSHVKPDDTKLLIPDLSNARPKLELLDMYASLAERAEVFMSSPRKYTSQSLDASPSPMVLTAAPSNAIRSDRCVSPIKDTVSSSKEFSILKKVEEKNEFKMVVALGNKKNPSVPGNILSILSSSSSDGILMGKGFDCDDMARMTDETNGIYVENIPEAATTVVPTTPQIERSTESSLSPANPAMEVELDYEKTVQTSFSSESDCSSCLSLESSIGEITICEETKRLIEAHTLYTEDAMTNINHPSRQRKSVMRVGSVLKNASQPKQSERSKSDQSLSVVAEAPSNDYSVKTVKYTKLTWYDDEVNWTKPFTLRTDESFDVSTTSTALSRSKRIVQYNVMDQFIGEFINGICHARVNVDFDFSEQEEI